MNSNISPSSGCSEFNFIYSLSIILMDTIEKKKESHRKTQIKSAKLVVKCV